MWRNNRSVIRMACFIWIGILLTSCQPTPGSVIEDEFDVVPVVEIQPGPVSLGQFERKAIQERLKTKIDHKSDLYVHVLVPLCDNEHQGIVPVNKTLGDGFNPRTNLYWGALYGVKTHFNKHADWTLIHTEKNPNDDDVILERVIFEKKRNGQKTYLVADAYRGDKMKACLLDYMNSVAGIIDGNVKHGETEIGIHGSADLIVFNGHNGLMDVVIPTIENKDGIHKDAIAIACASHGFFSSQLEYSGGFPLLMTTNLLAPEAYVLEAVVSEWAKGSEGVSIADAAGRAYNQYQKCGTKGARRLFKSGW